MNLELPTIKIKKKHARRLRYGYLWVFSNEIETPPKLSAGTLIQVVDSEGFNHGTAFYNPHSLIAARLLSTTGVADVDFFRKRIETAASLRQKLYPNENCVRLVFGESDALPGLIIDKYENCFILQTLSAGMYQRKEIIAEALKELFSDCAAIALRNDSRLVEIEGLPKEKVTLSGSLPEELITSENGIRICLNLADSQKTGWFLDQKDNRLMVRRLSKGAKVLDCFCNQGGFALNSAIAGAAQVVGVDISGSAISSAQKNAALNKLSNIEFRQADVMEFLAAEFENKSAWHIIVLDPPAFAKSKSAVPQAKAAYEKINRMALRLIQSGGFLVTSSCSQHVDESEFGEIVAKAASKSYRRIKCIGRGIQAADHPILPAMPETKYLKFYIYHVE